MRILSIDYGTKRIGLAIADTEVSIAMPLCSVAVTSTMAAAAEEVARIAKDEGAQQLVVGRPTRMTGSGEMGESEKGAVAFADLLAAACNLPVDFEDERFSTSAAVSARFAAGASTKKFDRDASAAANILETWLVRKGRT